MADDANRREDVDDEQGDTESAEASQDADQADDGDQVAQESPDAADGDAEDADTDEAADDGPADDTGDGAAADDGDDTDDGAAAGDGDGEGGDDDGAEEEKGGKGGKGKRERGSKTQRGSGSPRPVPGGLDIVQHARAILTRATGRRPESVTGLQRDGDIWQVTLDVVELERIPSSSDVMAEYLIELTPDGELVGYRRINRFYRSQASNRDQV